MHFKSFTTPLWACALAFVLGIGSLRAQSVANYTTTFSTTGSLMSMTGSTDIFDTGTYRDDVASTVTNFPSGFSFVYMGTVYTQFSVNSNGQFRFGGSAIAGTNVTPASGNALLAPMGGDNVILASGKVHFLLTGTAPNRQFVVEWLDLRIPYAASPATGTGTQLQIVLNESNGSIEFRYGSVFNNSTSVSRSIFMSNGSTSATNSKYINLTGPAESNTGTAVSNSLPDNAAVTGLNSAANGSRTVFTFTPISAPVAPSGISFTNVFSNSVTVNWADNSSNELGFLVERSTDGSNFTTVSTTAANATSLAITGLVPSTNYTIRVRAFNDGRLSTALTGTQTTNSISTYVWNQTGTADYATATNWTPNRTTPDPSDILEFSNGATTTATGVTTQTIGRLLISGNTSVTLQSAATATLTIGGGTGTDLDIPAGSSLILGSANTFTLTHASSAGNTSSIAGTLTVNASNTYTSSTSANNITTVTGTLNNAGTINGATAALLMNSGSTYNHNFTTAGGTIPTATWDVASTVSFTTYTSNSSAPGGIGQSFGNFTWNCTAQTGNINFDNGSLVVRGTFTLAATNSGSVRLTGSTSRTVSFNNVNVSGGTLDFASGSGVLTMRVFGTFNQSGGTITESSTGTGVIEFADTLGTSQNVTLGTINNTFRYIVSDVQGINLTGTMTIATNGSLIINTVAATPINGGTLVYGTAPTTLQYGNGTSGMAALTATAAIFPASSGPSNLTINNANGVNLGFSRTVTTLTMTSGNINLSGNTLTLGTSASAAGTLSYTAGLIQGGTFSRWFPTTGLPTSASTSIGYYPMGHNSNNRQVQLFFSAATALSTGGTISVTHNNVIGTSVITGFSDGAITVDRRTNSNWVIATGNGIAATGTISMAIRGDNTSFPTTVADLRLIRATDAVGTSSNGTGSSTAPVANRTAVSLTDLASTFYIGSTSSNLATIYTANSSGNWGDNATWDLGTPPTSNDLAVINSGVTVTVAGTTTPYNCLNLTVNGTLTANANTLTIGGTSANGLTVNSGGTVNVGGGTIVIGPANGSNRTLSMSGTMTVSSGNVVVNGNLSIASGATFTQSGGNITIDGNRAGDAAASVASGTAIVQINTHNLTLSGGTMTIVDPHANATATNTFSFNTSLGHVNADTSHTLQLGNGTSSDTSANATNAFRLNTWQSSSRISFGRLLLNCGSGTNRFVTTTYDFGVHNLTINANSELRQSSTLYVSGNLVNNGTLVSTSTISMARFLSGTESASSQAQNITGTGSFINSTTSSTANISSLTINNASTGVTLNVPIRVSGTLTLTRGKLNTTSTNILRLGTTTAAGTLSGTSDSSFIDGPFVRTFAASRTASGTYTNVTLFPTGKGSVYAPIHIDPSTSSGGAVEVSAEFLTSHSGTGGAGVSNLSTVNWSTSTTAGSGNLTNVFVRISHSGVDSTSRLLHASTANGTYSGTPGGSTSSGTGRTVTTASAIPSASILGFYAYGRLTPCTAPTDTATAFTASLLTTTSFTANFTAANNAPTGYLVVRYTASETPVLPTDGVIYTGSALGGTIAANLTAAPFRFTQSGLTANTQYTFRVYSYNNSGCAGPVYLTSSRLNANVTTCATTTATTGTPVASNRTTNSMTIRFTNSTTSSSTYFADVSTNSGFTTFLSGYEGFSLGTDTSFNLTGLSAGTSYFVRIRAASNNCVSAFSTTLSTSTLCIPVTSFPYSQNFSSMLPSICWDQGKTGNFVTGPATTGSSNWIADGYLNSGSTGAARMNIFNTPDRDWLISEQFVLPAGTNKLKYKIGVTQYDATSAPTTPFESDDSIYVAVNVSRNTSWTVVKTYGNTNVPSHLGQTDSVDLSAYENDTIKIAFIAVEGVSNGSADVDVFIDDMSIEALGVNTWNGTGLWSNTANWSQGTPASGNNVIIGSGTVQAIAGATIKNITVNSGASVTVPNATSLTVNGALTNNGTLTVQNGGNLVQGTSATIGGSGSFAASRNSGNTSNLRYNMWSSPNAVSTLSSLGGSDWYEFNTASNAWSNSGLSGSTTMTVGKGYSSTGAGNVLFTGTFNNGNLTPAVDATGNGFNLVGNPYPSTINARIFLDSNTNINGTLYYWSQPNNSTLSNIGGDYASWTTLGGTAGSVGGSAPDSNIGVAQGFFVKANSGTTIRFTNSMRSTNVGSNFRVGTAEKAWFNITSNQGLFNQILLGFSPEASDATDRMDAVKMKGNADISFYSVLNNEHLSIQAMAPRGNTTRIVPVGFDVAAAGAYSIALDRTEALGNEVDIFVKDLATGTLHNLRTQAYNFSVGQAGTHTNRLQIHFGPALSTSVSNVTNAEQVHIYSAGQTVYMHGFKEGTLVDYFEVRDAAGRLVLNMSRPQASDLSSVQLSVAPGIYLARIVTNNGTKTQRIYLSK